MVGPESSKALVRSQTQTSSSAEVISDSSRSRTGSARALKDRASSPAASGPRASADNGVQHACFDMGLY
jgi:hypothetical protein